MTIDFAAGKHTSALWQQVLPTVKRIEKLPFLNELASGSLDSLAFTNYICQDGLYLNGYARAMSALAAKAPEREQSKFWAESSARAISVEQGMHASLLADPKLVTACATLNLATVAPTASPTTLGYVSYLIATAMTDSYGVGVAGVLPCFWVYAHMGKVLVERAARLGEQHPYATWVATYDSPAFDANTREAVAILEQQLESVSKPEQKRMHEAFAQACTYELHFWASAHDMQGWDAY